VEKIFKNLSPDDRRSLSLRDMYVGQAKRYKALESICIQMELCGENLRKWLNQQLDKDDKDVKKRSIQNMFRDDHGSKIPS
jgi:hypothetical protein